MLAGGLDPVVERAVEGRGGQAALSSLVCAHHVCSVETSPIR